MSPLAFPPLKRLGRLVTRRLHGNVRSADGLLLTRDHYLDEDQEWRLGQAYLGALGVPLFVLLLIGVEIAYYDQSGPRGRIHLGTWRDLSPAMKLVIPLAIASHLIGFASAIRLKLLWSAISEQPRDDLGA